MTFTRLRLVTVALSFVAGVACGNKSDSGGGEPAPAAAPAKQTLSINGKDREIETACGMWTGDWSLGIYLAAGCDLPCKEGVFAPASDRDGDTEVRPSSDYSDVCETAETVTLVVTAAVGTKMAPGVYGYAGDARRQVQIYPGARLETSSGDMKSVLVDTEAVEGIELVEISRNKAVFRFATDDKLLRLKADAITVPLLPGKTPPQTLSATSTEVPAKPPAPDADALKALSLPVPSALADSHHWLFEIGRVSQWHLAPKSEDSIWSGTEGIVLTLAFLGNERAYDFTHYPASCGDFACRFEDSLGDPSAQIRLPNIVVNATLRGESAAGPASQATLGALMKTLPLAAMAKL